MFRITEPTTDRQPRPVPGGTSYIGDVMRLLRRQIKHDETIESCLDLGTRAIFPDNVQRTAIINRPSKSVKGK